MHIDEKLQSCKSVSSVPRGREVSHLHSRCSATALSPARDKAGTRRQRLCGRPRARARTCRAARQTTAPRLATGRRTARRRVTAERPLCARPCLYR
ncbi:Protein of unknown function [Gryllus bimaculatus]|nr:Protein of unknown function [Gryllus bimaculatus]